MRHSEKHERFYDIVIYCLVVIRLQIRINPLIAFENYLYEGINYSPLLYIKDLFVKHIPESSKLEEFQSDLQTRSDLYIKYHNDLLLQLCLFVKNLSESLLEYNEYDLTESDKEELNSRWKIIISGIPHILLQLLLYSSITNNNVKSTACSTLLSLMKDNSSILMAIFKDPTDIIPLLISLKSMVLHSVVIKYNLQLDF